MISAIQRLISELMSFVKLLLKINNTFFEARLASVEQVFLRSHNIFDQVISIVERNRFVPFSSTGIGSIAASALELNTD